MAILTKKKPKNPLLKYLPKAKKKFATVEKSGDTSGDWLKLEKSTFKDLKNRRNLPDVSYDKVVATDKKGNLKNPSLYNKVANVYTKDLKETFGIPYKEQPLWSYRPAYYKKYKSIENIPKSKQGSFGKPAREVMEQRKQQLKDAGFRKKRDESNPLFKYLPEKKKKENPLLKYLPKEERETSLFEDFKQFITPTKFEETEMPERMEEIRKKYKPTEKKKTPEIRKEQRKSVLEDIEEPEWVKTYRKEGENVAKAILAGKGFKKKDTPYGKQLVIDVPKKVAKKFKNKSWLDVWSEYNPLGKKISSKEAVKKAKGLEHLYRFPQWIATDWIPSQIMNLGTKPSTYIIWGALQRLMPKAMKFVGKKIAKRNPKLWEFLSKKRRAIPKKYLQRAKGELTSLRHRLGRLVGKEYQTALKQPTAQELKQMGRTAEAARTSPKVFQRELGKRTTGMGKPVQRPTPRPTPKAKPKVTALVPKETRIAKVASAKKGKVKLDKTKFIPEQNKLKKAKDAFLRAVDVEAPFKKIGADETGFQLKNYHNIISLYQNKATDVIKSLSKAKLPKEIDYTDLTFISERPTLFKALSPKARKEVSPQYQKVRKYYSEMEGRLKDIGWLKRPFPESLVHRRTEEIKSLKNALNRTKGEVSKNKIRNKIKEYQSQIDRIRKQNIQFVSVPAKMMMNKAAKGGNEQLRNKIMSILPKWGRETVTIKDLVDKDILSRKEADIRKIIGEYANRTGRKLALGRIMTQAEEDGLIHPTTEAPEDWEKFSTRLVPQLRGRKLEPAFNAMLESFFSGGGGKAISPALGIIKMMQFYNPLFLPYYDIQQAMTLGTLANIKAPKYIIKGVSDVLKKTPNYYEAMENGIFSKPFTIGWNDYEKQINKLIEDTKAKEVIKNLGLPHRWIKHAYHASWNIAWTGDKLIRMMSYNYLKGDGMSPRVAAQTSALAHGDYASLPPKTKRRLNRIFFTPTFKIVMTKYYNQMLKQGVKTIGGMKPGTKGSSKVLGRALAYTLALLGGTDFYFRSRGFKREQWFRRYTKEIETPKGKKELNITLSNPFNIPWRYFYKAKQVFKPSTKNKAIRALKSAKWELHPLYRVGIELLFNQGSNYKPIYNPFDDPEGQIADIVKYTSSELVRIAKPIIEPERGKDLRKAYDALQKDLGKLETMALRPFVFPYIGETEDKTTTWAIRSLEKSFNKFLAKDKPKNDKERRKRIKNFRKKLKQIKKKLK